jgi:hypothetical protein
MARRLGTVAMTNAQRQARSRERHVVSGDADLIAHLRRQVAALQADNVVLSNAQTGASISEAEVQQLRQRITDLQADRRMLQAAILRFAGAPEAVQPVPQLSARQTTTPSWQPWQPV